MNLMYSGFLSCIVCALCYSQTLGKYKIVSDLQPDECFIQDLNYVEAHPNDGLPRCAPFEDSDESICNQYYNPNSVYSTAQNKPACDKNGHFAPKQCKGERRTGRCFCYGATGNRLFGQQWWMEADDMTCSCSRKKVELSSSMYFCSLHCNNVGNYEPLQCDILSNQCWCADEKSGQLTSPVVPEGAMNRLPCYNSLNHGTRYLRQCEHRKMAENRIVQAFKSRGTRIHFEEFLCDDDGSYGLYTIINNLAYCTWRDNTNIGSWQTQNRTGVNCNCARDTILLASVGQKQIQHCTANGNYAEFQTIGGSSYCVDELGYRKSDAGVNVEDYTQCAEYITYR